LLSEAILQGGGNIQEYELITAQLKDSAEEITHLYKKLHPHFPTGTCYNCGSVTEIILGSGRRHYACVACGTEVIND
jgi:transposase